MRPYLVFQMVAPMVSWGDIAIGEVRPSAAHPSRSAVVGLVSAALGIRRDQAALLQQVDDAYCVGVWVEHPGTCLRDYHTAQVPTSSGPRRASRREELAHKADLSTILSTREYRTDFVGLASLWCRQESVPYSLEQLADALRRPVFSPYFGRRSCPPGLPLAPLVVTAEESLEGAFGAYRAQQPGFDSGWSRFRKGLDRAGLVGGSTAMLWDLDGLVSDVPERVTVRRDRPLSRATWQFVNRKEAQLARPRTSGRKEG